VEIIKHVPLRQVIKKVDVEPCTVVY
jgi:hypothetical protein